MCMLLVENWDIQKSIMLKNKNHLKYHPSHITTATFGLFQFPCRYYSMDLDCIETLKLYPALFALH